MLANKIFGAALVTSRIMHSDCLQLVDRVSRRIQGWRGKYLPYAGRLQLIKAVMNNLTIYWISCFLLLLWTTYEINRLCRNFLWTRPDCTTSHALIGWEDMCVLFDEGGLGIRDLATTNKAAILRHLWNVVSDKNTLWVSWIKKYMIRNRCFWQVRLPCECSWSWRGILKGRRDASFIARKIIGDGKSTFIWLEPWTDRGALYEQFPEALQFHPACNKTARVSNMIENEVWTIPDFVRDRLAGLDTIFEETEIWGGC